jgi:hypothetical protein
LFKEEITVFNGSWKLHGLGLGNFELRQQGHISVGNVKVTNVHYSKSGNVTRQAMYL